MEHDGVTERLLNRTVLITGATGFIAKRRGKLNLDA